MGGTFSTNSSIKNTIYSVERPSLDQSNEVIEKNNKQNKKSGSIPVKPSNTQSKDIPYTVDNKEVNNSLNKLSEVINLNNMGVTIDSKNAFIIKDLERKYNKQNDFINSTKNKYIESFIKLEKNNKRYNNYLYYRSYIIILLVILIIIFVVESYLIYKKKFNK